MNLEIKEITALPTLMHWREEVIRSVFGIEPSKRILAVNRQYYREHIADGSHVAMVAEIDGAGVGCGAICLQDELPSPDNPSGKCAFIMNIYVREDYRRRGIGEAIVRRLVEKGKELGCDKIYLESTIGAHNLYESIGFADMPGMMKFIY